ncbi:MAG: DMT family transporter [Candidatus Hodarchaeales archaeon]|jgi:drug/metabolite transporter (DMT)-like permease
MSYNQLSKAYLFSVIQALFVTVLWSSSFIIIKWGLEDIPPILFSGFRYTIASAILLIIILSNNEQRKVLSNLSSYFWIKISIYGLLFVTLTQGLQFLGLYYLPAISFSLILNLTIIVVLILSIFLLNEQPTILQAFLIIITFVGIYLYFDDKIALEIEIIGLFVALFAMFSNSLSTIMGRAINKTKEYTPLLITGLSMSFGSIVLLACGFLFEEIPNLTPISIIYILWLGTINTALAFTIWNKTMQTLRAIDISIINSTMLPQIVILSLIFLGEQPNFVDWIGIIIVALCVIIIQINQAKRLNTKLSNT